MNKEEFIKKYDVNPNMDERTLNEILNFNNDVMSLDKFKNVVKDASKKLDKRIKREQDILSPKDTCWGGAFDKLVAETMNKYQNKYKYRKCLNHNTERDCVCENNRSLDIEVKTALDNYCFYNHRCENGESSPKYKGLDEYDYYLFVRWTRDITTCKTTINKIYFGRLCERNWVKKNLHADMLENQCVRIF